MPTIQRLLTDDTGQALVTAINNIVAAVKPNATEIQMSSSDTTTVATAITNINDKIGTVPSGQTVEGQITTLNSKIVNLDSVFRTPEEHQITRIGTYFTERSAFKARRMGNLVNIYSYVNITTQVPPATQFADTGFSTASGVLLFCQGDGTQPTVVRCEGGKLIPDSAIATGYYYAIGALSAYIP